MKACSLGRMTRDACALSLVLLVGVSCINPRDDRPKVARVNGIPIYVAEFLREYRRIKLDSNDGPPTAATIASQKRALLESLIDRRLLLQQVEHANVILSSAEVDAAFARARTGWSDEELGKSLQEKDSTPAELKNELRDTLLIRRYFRDHVFSRIAVTDQEIEAYVAAHPETLIEPEKVRALHVICKTEEEATRVLAEIKAGLAFEDAVMKYSLVPDAKNGGSYGLVARGVMPRIFDDVCFNLPAGKVSDPQSSENGYYIFKVLEKRPQQTLTIEAVRESIEAKIRQDKTRAAEEAKLAELRRAASIEIEEDELERIR